MFELQFKMLRLDGVTRHHHAFHNDSAGAFSVEHKIFFSKNISRCHFNDLEVFGDIVSVHILCIDLSIHLAFSFVDDVHQGRLAVRDHFFIFQECVLVEELKVVFQHLSNIFDVILDHVWQIFVKKQGFFVDDLLGFSFHDVSIGCFPNF